MKKLTRKERKFVDDVENRKNYIAYRSIRLYGETDIPVRADHMPKKNNLIPPAELWEDFDPTGEPLRAEKLDEGENFARFSYLAASYPDGNLTAEINVYSPPYYARKAVLLVGDKDALPQQEIIDAIVQTVGAYVFVADYNALRPESGTVFPPSLAYGKHGAEQGRLFALPDAPDASPKDTCPYLYVLILRRAVAFIKHNFPFADLLVTGIRYGTELAMAVAGLEKESVIALGCLCGSGYPQYADIPKYPHSRDSFTGKEMRFIVSLSGVSHLKNYPKPVFCALGSNSTFSSVDRLSSLKSLIAGPLTLYITPQYADSIDENAFRQYLTWLNASFWRSDFPAPPNTTININRDGSVYADVAATATPDILNATLFYSYDDNDHRTRLWTQVPCETVGVGQYLAKMTFSKPCDSLFFYTQVAYRNGLVVTETPKYLNVSSYRIALLPARNNAVLFRYGAEGVLTGDGEQAVLLEEPIREKSVASGIKGAVNETGTMKLYGKDAFSAMSPERILQVDSFKEGGPYSLELQVTVGTDPATFYRAVKTVTPCGNFACTHFSCTDFKDERFLPLTGWDRVNALTVLSAGVAINKIMFI